MPEKLVCTMMRGSVAWVVGDGGTGGGGELALRWAQTYIYCDLSQVDVIVSNFDDPPRKPSTRDASQNGQGLA